MRSPRAPKGPPQPRAFADDSPARRPKPQVFADPEPATPRDRATVQEHRLGKKMGFRPTPGSGSRPWVESKGDGQNDDFVYESKTTQRASFSLSREVLAKVSREARNVGKIPVLLVSWEGERPPELAEDYVVVEADYFRELLERGTLPPK